MSLFKKYDIDNEKNIPQVLYGVPDEVLKKWEEDNNKYNIEPSDNIPREVYGIPEVNKYDIKPEDNIPQKVYGVPFQNKNIKKCIYCNSQELWEYLYGEPIFDYDRDKYILGGCEVIGNQPRYKCKKCGKDIY